MIKTSYLALFQEVECSLNISQSVKPHITPFSLLQNDLGNMKLLIISLDKQ